MRCDVTSLSKVRWEWAMRTYEHIENRPKRTCLDCPADITDRHGRTKRCLACAKRAMERMWASRWPANARANTLAQDCATC